MTKKKQKSRGKRRDKQSRKGSPSVSADGPVSAPTYGVPFSKAGGTFNIQRTELFQAVAYTGAVITGSLNFGSASWPSFLVSFVQQGWDYFRTNKVIVTFVPRWTSGSSAVAGTQMPNLAMASNYDDFATPASFDAVLSKDRSKFCPQWDTPQAYAVTPNSLVSLSINGGAGLSSKGLLGRPLWLNAISLVANSIDLAGLAYGVSGVATPPLGGYEIWITWDISVRGALF